MEKYQNKYRTKTNRLQNWDYGWNGAYFVTICTKNREHYFGNIYDDKIDNELNDNRDVETPNLGVSTIIQYKIQLSAIGKTVTKYWYEIPNHFPFVKLGTFVVMPNHIHGIIIIDKIDDERNVETQNFASLPSPPQRQHHLQPKNKFGPQSQNLASIIRGFKIGVTKNARKINPDFAWQPRFYDHIIRNEKSFNTIKNYIINNPQNWNNDKLHNQINEIDNE